MAERNVLLKNVKHPFLVGLHYSFQTTDKLYFVLDFVNGGEVSFVIGCLIETMARKKSSMKSKRFPGKVWAERALPTAVGE